MPKEANPDKVFLKQYDHKESLLLNEGENEKLFSIVESKCQIMCCAVVRLVMTMPPHHEAWVVHHTGVVSFTKDYNRRSFYIQQYDLEEGMKVFEQELYRDFQYHCSDPQFHQFEGSESMVGLAFASIEEAALFERVIMNKLEEKRKKKEEKTKAQLQVQRSKETMPGQRTRPVQQTVTRSTKSTKTKKKQKKKRPVSKSDISQPINFRHVDGVSMHDDERLKDLFCKVGVTTEHLENPEIRRMIYSTIEQNGGIERARQESMRYSRVPNSEHPRNHARAAPPPPLPKSTSPPLWTSLTPEIHLTTIDESPTQRVSLSPFTVDSSDSAMDYLSTAVKNRQSSLSSAGAQSAASSSILPPPPPPPPPSPPPPLPTSPPPYAEVNNPSRVRLHPNDDGRSALLDQIRSGNVEENEIAVHEEPLDGIAGALKKVLDERLKSIQPDEDDGSKDSSDYEDDWADEYDC